MSVEPLHWPEALRHPNNLQKFLQGFPLIGPESRAWRDIRHQLKQRPEDSLTLWKQDDQTITARDAIIDVLHYSFGWKGRKFIPGDPCEILFFSKPGDGLDLVDAVYRIERQFGIKLDTDRLLLVKGMTLGELVDAIVQKRWETPPKDLPAEKTRVSRLGCVVMSVLILILAAMAVLTSRFAMSRFSPVATAWAFKVTGILGMVNAALGVVAWAISGRRGFGVFLVAALGSLLLGLFLLLVLGAT